MLRNRSNHLAALRCNLSKAAVTSSSGMMTCLFSPLHPSRTLILLFNCLHSESTLRCANSGFAENFSHTSRAPMYLRGAVDLEVTHPVNSDSSTSSTNRLVETVVAGTPIATQVKDSQRAASSGFFGIHGTSYSQPQDILGGS
ncbi:hypothetical protein K7432_010205 [Basidiobolus ranarum]|uniref:Uncharacterized protein n=1 Tax=Basidiobolus ranarum TaxID=34480 RepID=A0ABR2WP77_9FUNG